MAPADLRTLAETARALVAPRKGILAADESSGTIKKRFDSIGVESTEDRRRFYREMLFTTEGHEEFVSGVILFDETIRQSASDGRTLVQVLTDAGVIPGIKVDKGAKALAGATSETVTEGLDGLRERLEEYVGLGARFAKWRATYTITHDLPSPYAVEVNAHALARYAALCQEAGLVPIVEPEVTISIADKAAAEDLLLPAIARHLDALPEGSEVMLKLTLPETPNLYRPLIEHPRVMRVVALSGGYTREQANARLAQNAGMIASFSRALTEGLSADQTDAEFDRVLRDSIESIYAASVAG